MVVLDARVLGKLVPGRILTYGFAAQVGKLQRHARVNKSVTLTAFGKENVRKFSFKVDERLLLSFKKSCFNLNYKQWRSLNQPPK